MSSSSLAVYFAFSNFSAFVTFLTGVSSLLTGSGGGSSVLAVDPDSLFPLAVGILTGLLFSAVFVLLVLALLGLL